MSTLNATRLPASRRTPVTLPPLSSTRSDADTESARTPSDNWKVMLAGAAFNTTPLAGVTAVTKGAWLSAAPVAPATVTT